MTDTVVVVVVVAAVVAAGTLQRWMVADNLNTDPSSFRNSAAECNATSVAAVVAVVAAAGRPLPYIEN